MSDARPPTPVQKPTTEENYYQKRLSYYFRKVFDLALSAGFYVVADFIFRLVLKALGVTEKTAEGHYALPIIRVMLIVSYVAYSIRVIAPDVSENLAETLSKIKRDWWRPKRRKP